jgi:hypothetical protein
MLLKGLQEGHLHIDVILVDRLGDLLRLPGFEGVCDRLAVGDKLVRPAVADPNHLPGPGPLAFVEIALGREFDALPAPMSGNAATSMNAYIVFSL